jgi:hypothetical protein
MEGLMREMEKLQVLIGHWMEHNAAHAEEFLRWAERARHEGCAAAASEIAEAAGRVREATQALGRAQAQLGSGGGSHVPE